MKNLLIPDLKDCGYPPISTAPNMSSYPEHIKVVERSKLYASVDTETGKVYLIQNPTVWLEREIAPGKWVKHRPKPIPIEQAPSDQDHREDIKVQGGNW